MNHDQITFHIEHSTSIKLLRSDYAPLALGFFDHAFKKQQRVQIPYDELKSALSQYLEALKEEAAQGRSKEKYPHSADHYLSMWCSESHRFIRKYYDHESDTPIVELTYDSERAIEWMENLEKKDFVGTHSRFAMIFENLKTLAEQSDITATTRRKYLEEKKVEINQELKQIDTTGTFKRMDVTHIQELFFNLIEDSRKLITDFCLVEDIFKDLAQKVKEQKLKEFVTKGALLGQILDAYDYLEESNQGKSFNSFWNFLMSSTRQEELNSLIKKALNASELEHFVQQSKNHHHIVFFKKFKANLLQIGQKVLKSKSRLSEELRKLLHQHYLMENKQVVSEIFEIKKMLIENKEHFTGINDFITVDFLVKIILPMERPLWAMKELSNFQNIDLKQNEENMALLSPSEIKELANCFHVDVSELIKNVEQILKSANQVTLENVIKKFPITRGIGELLAYLDFAIESPHRSAIDFTTVTKIKFSTYSGNGIALAPQIIFSKADIDTALTTGTGINTSTSISKNTYNDINKNISVN